MDELIKLDQVDEVVFNISHEDELQLSIGEGVVILSGSSVTIITEYNDESSLPKNPKENDVCILNSSNLRTWVYLNGTWVEYPILINEEVNDSGGVTLIIANNSLKEEVNEEGGTTLIIGG